MKRIAVSIAALLLAMQPSFAQMVPTEAQLQQARTTMFQAEAQFFSLLLQWQAAEAAATKKYWEEYLGAKQGKAQ